MIESMLTPNDRALDTRNQVTSVLITNMHRQLPPHHVDRGHHGSIVRIASASI